MVVMRLLSVSVLLSSALAGCADPPVGAERGEVLFQSCVACHGEEGEGNQEYGAPAIAGLDVEYVKTQLEHFRVGARGAHPDDREGLRMRPMVQTLRHEGDLESVAAYVASLPAPHPEPTVTGGDPTRGRAVFATCAECHGADGAGNPERDAPRLAGSSDWYLLAQLTKFREGVRGTDERDTTGSTMRPMAMSIADEQSMRDVVAYIATLSN